MLNWMLRGIKYLLLAPPLHPSVSIERHVENRLSRHHGINGGNRLAGEDSVYAVKGL
jgi:hypothetical protein